MLAFDLDNTLFSSLNSDYKNYLIACQKLFLKPIPLLDYSYLRKNEGMLVICEKTGVNEMDMRNALNENFDETFYLEDELILDLQKYLTHLQDSQNIIITRRKSKEIAIQQLKNMNLDYLFEVNHIWSLNNEETASKKAEILLKFNPSLYIGDKCSDSDAARIAGVEFIWVNTGFFCNLCFHERKYTNINVALDSVFQRSNG